MNSLQSALTGDKTMDTEFTFIQMLNNDLAELETGTMQKPQNNCDSGFCFLHFELQVFLKDHTLFLLTVQFLAQRQPWNASALMFIFPLILSMEKKTKNN